MAVLSIKVDDELKEKAKYYAKKNNVSVSYYISRSLSALFAQQDALSFFDNRLKGKSAAKIANGFNLLIDRLEKRKQKPPTMEEI